MFHYSRSSLNVHSTTIYIRRWFFSTLFSGIFPHLLLNAAFTPQKKVSRLAKPLTNFLGKETAVH